MKNVRSHYTPLDWSRVVLVQHQEKADRFDIRLAVTFSQVDSYLRKAAKLGPSEELENATLGHALYWGAALEAHLAKNEQERRTQPRRGHERA